MYAEAGVFSTWREDLLIQGFVFLDIMGSVERAGDATSEVESGEEEEIVAGGELAAHLMKRYVFQVIFLRLAESIAYIPEFPWSIKCIRNLFNPKLVSTLKSY